VLHENDLLFLIVPMLAAEAKTRRLQVDNYICYWRNQRLRGMLRASLALDLADHFFTGLILVLLKVERNPLVT